MLLNFSILIFIVGLVITVFEGLSYDWWSARSVKVGDSVWVHGSPITEIQDVELTCPVPQITILFGFTGAFAGVNYLACTYLLYDRIIARS
jgi:hypothetical protein